MSEQATVGRHAGLLRAWHLAILRFVLTRDNGDRVGLFAVANEIDRLGSQQDVRADFSFFRRKSTELSAAIVRRQRADDVVLSGYLAQIDDARLVRALAAALEIPQPKPDLTRKHARPGPDLWRGLPSRASSQP